MAEVLSVPCTFAGFSLSASKEKVLLQDQHTYLRRGGKLSPDSFYAEYRSIRVRLPWLADTRPDCLYEWLQLAQATTEIFNSSNRERIRRLKRAVSFAVVRRVTLRVSKLEKNGLSVSGDSDSFFANSADLFLQLGYICCSEEKRNAVSSILLKSYNFTRVTRSAIARK